MKPLRPRYKRIDQRVGLLLHKHKIVNSPVPVDNIAEGLGAKIIYENFNGEISGLLLKRPGSIIIGVHKAQAPTRKRFTIAHEIGHLEMHSGALEQVHVDKNFEMHLRSAASSTAEDVAEIEANTFAACLLMPRNLVMRDVGDQILDFEDPRLVRQLAEKYQVSTQAMTFRLINLYPQRSLAAAW
jgi:Zn-dependent peptidase ImmA (M78 family)